MPEAPRDPATPSPTGAAAPRTSPASARRTRPAGNPPAPTGSSLPSTGARILAFGAILLGGLAGGLIGWGFVDLQCTGSCTTGSAVGALIGAVMSAVGVAVIAVLVLRAMGEWRTIQRPPDQVRE